MTRDALEPIVMIVMRERLPRGAAAGNGDRLGGCGCAVWAARPWSSLVSEAQPRDARCCIAAGGVGCGRDDEIE